MIYTVDIKCNKFCAFCKYWYDPANKYIEPHIPSSNLWKYESTAKCMCMKKNYQVGAGSYCFQYECKI